MSMMKSVQAICNWSDEYNSVIETGKRNAFRVYPNPTHSECTVEYDARSRATITICDLQGRILQTFFLPEGMQTYRVDLSGLEPAIYLVRIQCEGVNKFV